MKGFAYLLKLEADQNHNRYYRMVQEGDRFKIEMGRIGARPVCMVRPMTLWDTTYQKKIKEGYEDRSEFCDVSVEKNQNYKPIPDFVVAELMEYLQKEANQILEARYVDELLANSTGDFAYIMQREENLIQAMEAVATASTNPHQTDTFADIGVEVYYANEKQKAQVLRHLNDQLIPKVKNIYRVIPGKQQKRFNKYIQEKGIDNVRQLWHGSRNENWLSIAKNGLLLNPNAVITGKMFGNGIYFATSSMKSWNYTSYRGTTWAGGTDDVGFMGLYAVAYGTPYDVSSSYHFTKAELNRLHADCVHAHAGTALRNDEIIFFDENAMVLNYIVEFQ